jgi:hypothetical protein
MVSDATLHALVGAIATIVLSFVPFSPVLGGGIAAYLNGADTSRGVRVGAVSGLIATVPLVLLGLLFAVVFGAFAVGARGGVVAGLGGILIVLVFGVVATVYTVGLSALGGYLGAYVVDGV